MKSLYSDHRTWLHGVSANAKLLLFAALGTPLGKTTATCVHWFLIPVDGIPRMLFWAVLMPKEPPQKIRS